MRILPIMYFQRQFLHLANYLPTLKRLVSTSPQSTKISTRLQSTKICNSANSNEIRSKLSKLLTFKSFQLSVNHLRNQIISINNLSLSNAARAIRSRARVHHPFSVERKIGSPICFLRVIRNVVVRLNCTRRNRNTRVPSFSSSLDTRNTYRRWKSRFRIEQ